MMRPFARRIDDQLDRYCRDLSWFDPSALKGFSDQACDILLGNPFIANEPGRIDKIKEAIDLRAMMLARHAREVRRERVSPSPSRMLTPWPGLRTEEAPPVIPKNRASRPHIGMKCFPIGKRVTNFGSRPYRDRSSPPILTERASQWEI